MKELVVLHQFEDMEQMFPEYFNEYVPYAKRLKGNLEVSTRILGAYHADPENETLHKEARKARLLIRKDRLAMEKTRKGMKDQLLDHTKAIDTPARELKKVMDGEEEKLLKIEQHAEEMERLRLIELEQTRRAEIEEAGGNPDHYPNLSGYEQPAFDALLFGIKAKIEAEAKAEAERIAKEKAEEEARQKELAEAKARADEAEAKAKARDTLRQGRMKVLSQYEVFNTKTDPADWTEEEYAANVATAEKMYKVKQTDIKRQALRDARKGFLNSVKGSYDGDLAELTPDEWEELFDNQQQSFLADEQAKADKARRQAEAQAEAEAKARAEEEAKKAKQDEYYQIEANTIQSIISPIDQIIGQLEFSMSKESQKISHPQAVSKTKEIIDALEKVIKSL